VSAEDFGTTLLHLLGVPHDYMLYDPLGRPHSACVDTVVPGLIG